VNSYVDVFIDDYSIGAVLAELARCLSLFSNLHTVQIDVTSNTGRFVRKIFEQAFKKYTYPQIRNVFVMSLSQSLIASCPEARYISFTPRWALKSYLQIIIDNCPRLEVLEDFTDHFWEADMCKRTILQISFISLQNPNRLHIPKSSSITCQTSVPSYYLLYQV